MHIWVPRTYPSKKGYGWVRQANPVYRKVNPLPSSIWDLNSIVPLLEVSRPRFAQWLRARVKQLGVTQGVLFVTVREVYEDTVICGVWHDNRGTSMHHTSLYDLPLSI